MRKDLVYLIIIGVLIAVHFLFPVIEPEVEIEYIPGDTVRVETIVTKTDTITLYVYKAIKDTLIIKDTVWSGWRSKFALGDSTLGTNGIVGFYRDEFNFHDIEYHYPEVTNTVIDTLKYTETKTPAFYKDYFFWTTLSAIALLVLSLVGG